MKEKAEPKRRLILLGNGFDKAHGLPTSYDEFILNYTIEEIKECLNSYMSNTENNFKHFLKIDLFRKDECQINIKYANTLIEELKECKNKKKLINYLERRAYSEEYQCPIHFEYLNSFAYKLVTENNGKNWSDIEAFFYKKFISCFGIKKSNEEITKRKSKILKQIKNLNKEFEKVKLALEKYLIEYVEKKYEFEPQKEFVDIFEGNEHTESILLLNFNYTKTAEMYLSSLEKYRPQLINIHGKLNENEGNPMIFGFGDEYDKLYKVIEEYNDNSLFKHIKSFGYVKTNNYHKMESFVETEPYEIFIIGHSCGLSDRTLLKYLFEHDHCSSIKIFYYEGEKGNTTKSRDNHNYTAQEISRHFEDKAKMRSRIVSFEDSVPCPQTPLEKKGK